MEKKPALTHTTAAFITALLAVLGFFAIDVNFYQPKTFAASPAMAAITVNSTAQSPGANGDCTFGEAIQAANANAAVDGCAAGSSGTDTIILAAGTYTFSTPGFIDFRGVGNAVPAIESDITIQGAGAASTIIERSAAAGTPDFRFFHHSESGAGTPTLTLNDITLRGGRPHAWGGGAIFAGGAGRVVANNCIFSNNQSNNWVGGAILAADVTINNSTFSGNSAIHGGAINTGDGPLTITNSTFTNNAATSTGGALSIRRQATISGSTFSNNTASDGGGALSKPGFFEPVIVSNSIFTGNTVTVGDRNGGAISSPNITLTNSTVSGNAATGQGGGIWSNDPTIIGSTISGNTADHGGGVHGQNITLENSTISGNFARQSGGGLVFGGTSSVLNINNATITNNTADSDNNGSGVAGGIYHTYSFSPSQTMNIRNTIIAGNINTTAPDCAALFNAAILSQGYNLISNSTGCNFTSAPGDQVGTPGSPINPQLGALANNGGATLTHALLANSPAIDTANPATPDGTGNSCLPTDQRIVVIRPVDGDGNGTPRCDIGAFEIVQSSAAMVYISGRIMTADGQGIAKSRVTLIKADGTTRFVLTGSFGYYRFENVEVGQAVLVSVASRRFVFTQPSRIITVLDAIEDADFTAEPR